MVLRAPDLGLLSGTGVSVGLHLELERSSAEGGRGARAGRGERERAIRALEEQLELLERALGSAPSHIDGHHHCHAAPGLAAALGRAAAARGLPLRSVGRAHRRTLRCLGVSTPDRLVGRLSERAPAVPPELEALIEHRGEPPPGVTEWMVHPGHPDPAAGSSYDRGRGEDLELLLELARREELRRLRTTHAGALGGRGEGRP